jgi:hypothetical protein
MKTLTEEELRTMFDEILDENYPPAVAGGYRFAASYVLKELDPIAYQEELRGYADSLRDEYLIPGWND